MGENMSNKTAFYVLLLTLTLCLNCFRQLQYQTAELDSIEEQITEQGGVRPATGKTDTLNFVAMWKDEGHREVFIRNVCQEFKILNQNIYLNMKFKEDIPEIRDNVENDREKNISRFITNQIQKPEYDWDIVPLLSGQMYKYTGDFLSDPSWGHQYLVDFREIPGFAETQNPDVLNNPTFSSGYDNIVTGPFIEGWYHVIYYNQDVAKDMGLEIKQFGMTTSDLLDYLKKIDEYNQTHSKHIAAFYDASDWINLGILWNYLLKSALGFSSNWVSPNRLNDTNQAAFYEVLKLFETMGQYHPLISSASTNKWNETESVILEDQAVFFVNGTWMYNLWEKIDVEKADKMIPCELPFIRPIDFYPGTFQADYAIFKHSKRKEEAVKFLMFMASKDIAEDWVQMAKSPTGIKRHFSSGVIGDDIYESFISTISEKYRNHIGDITVNVFGKNSQLMFELQDLHRLLRQEATADQIFSKYKHLLSRMGEV